jgi:hypothetical protein
MVNALAPRWDIGANNAMVMAKPCHRVSPK